MEEVSSDQKAHLWARLQSTQEWYSSPEDDVLIINKKLYKLVEVDHNIQKERIEVAKLPCHNKQSHTRKYAATALKMKNKDKPLFNDSMSYTMLDDNQFEKVLQGASSEELEEDEMIHVHVKGNKTLVHDKDFPVWNTKGFCYLTVIKVRAYPLFK